MFCIFLFLLFCLFREMSEEQQQETERGDGEQASEKESGVEVQLVDTEEQDKGAEENEERADEERADEGADENEDKADVKGEEKNEQDDEDVLEIEQEAATYKIKRALFVSLLPDLFDLNDEAVPGETSMYDVDPAVWGKHMWSVFHLIAYAYPENPSLHVKQAVFQIFDGMRCALMCHQCRGGYRGFWEDYDIRDYLDSRESLISWVLLIHDSVNEKLDAPPLDYPAYMERLIGEKVVEDDTEEENAAAEAEREKAERAKAAAEEAKRVADREAAKREPKRRSRSLNSRPSTASSSASSSASSVVVPKSTNPLAFRTAINGGETPTQKMDARRMRGGQAAAFARAQRMRLGNNSGSVPKTMPRPQPTTTFRESFSVGGASGNTNNKKDSAYYMNLVRSMTARRQHRAGADIRGIGKVKPPRECANCGPKVLTPSFF